MCGKKKEMCEEMYGSIGIGFLDRPNFKFD